MNYSKNSSQEMKYFWTQNNITCHRRPCKTAERSCKAATVACCSFEGKDWITYMLTSRFRELWGFAFTVFQLSSLHAYGLLNSVFLSSKVTPQDYTQKKTGIFLLLFNQFLIFILFTNSIQVLTPEINTWLRRHFVISSSTLKVMSCSATHIYTYMTDYECIL